MKRFDGHHCFKYQASRAQKGKQGFLIPAILTGLTTLCGISLSTPSTMAESSSASAAVIVVSACSLSATNTVPHTASIPPGTYRADIGSTTLKAFCNDQGGFAIYAIGYTDTTYGKNTLTANINNELIPSSDIATGTATSGSTSNWAMKLATNPSATYPISLDNGFGSYSAVPASYTKVASRESGTDAGSGATGSELTTTYAAFIKSGQEAGTYSGKVKYTMVHPYDAGTPPQPQTTEPGKICYYASASDAVGTMGCQTIPASGTTDGVSPTSATLLASNFSRNGYGFAGWSNEFDYATDSEAKFYGPQEDITYTEGQFSGDNNGLSLYAVWVKSAGSLQDSTKVATLCGTEEGSLTQAPTDGTANLSSVSALTDQRDNQTYAIAKLADGKCWMIENFRLDADSTRTEAQKSLSQGYGTSDVYGSFIGLADSESSNFSDSTVANSIYYIISQTGTASVGIGSSDYYRAYRMPRYNNSNTNNRAEAPSLNTNNIFSYGNYYTWHAAIADTTSYSSGDHSTTSLCPIGWRLPLGGKTVDEFSFGALSLALGGPDDGAQSNSGVVSAAFRRYPNNYLYNGTYNSWSVGNRGIYGSYWTSTTRSASSSFQLDLGSTYVKPGTFENSKYFGLGIRCVFNS